jgi:2-amino-4-hydroxy-6-hydroxymethyldihydropteridine diphosphokinase / dihydropteroate synthase
MLILGLGSNVEDRLQNLRAALRQIRQIPGLTVEQVSPLYISDALLPENAPADWDMPYLNLALRCETTLGPYDLLQQCKNIEITLGRKPDENWAPRPVDIDILAWDDLIQFDEKLHIPHEHLHERPFALWPLADVAPRWIYPLKNNFHGKTAMEIAAQWGSRFAGAAPCRTRQIMQRIDTPQLMGIINVSPDSFSDGHVFFDVKAIIERAYNLVEAGAEILDIGAEASGPNAISIEPELEWQRLEAVLTGILAESTNMLITPKISVDTRHAHIAKKALELGVDWINDVSGLSDPAMCEVIANSNCDVVIMHELGIPTDQNKILPLNENPVTAVYQWAEKILAKIAKLGIAHERVIVDIGIGFGKNAEQSLELLQSISEFQKLNTRLLVGHSRKSFLKLFTQHRAVERDVETLPVSLYLANLNIDYLRLHNVEMCARGLKVAKALS